MTPPRRIIPGQTLLLTRRTVGGQFLLVPCAAVLQVVQYVLSVAASRYGVEVHGFCVMANHYHIVVTPREANLPRFLTFFDANVARALNVHWERRGYFWGSGSYSAVHLVERGDVVRKLVYTAVNPVKAGLVPNASDWPGLWSDPEQIEGAPLRVERPSFFFADLETWPDEAQLRLTRPPDCRDQSIEEFRQSLSSRILEEAADIRAQREREGLGFLGRSAILSQSPNACPHEDVRQGQLNPRVACQNRARRIAELEILAAFIADYRQALSRYRAVWVPESLNGAIPESLTPMEARMPQCSACRKGAGVGC